MDIHTEHLTIERFEDNDLAVLERKIAIEDTDVINFVVPRIWLPEGCKEGDLLVVSRSEGTITFVVDGEGTARAAQEISNLRASLSKAPDGDIDL